MVWKLLSYLDKPIGRETVLTVGKEEPDFSVGTEETVAAMETVLGAVRSIDCPKTETQQHLNL